MRLKILGAVLVLLIAACDGEEVVVTAKKPPQTVQPMAGEIIGVLPTPTPTPAPRPTPSPTTTLAPLDPPPVQAVTPVPVVNQPVIATGSSAI